MNLVTYIEQSNSVFKKKFLLYPLPQKLSFILFFYDSKIITLYLSNKVEYISKSE